MEESMRRRIVLLSAALAVLLHTQAPLCSDALLAGEPEVIPSQGNLLAGVKWLKLEIVGGRLVARADRCSQSRLLAESPEDAPIREALLVESTRRGLIVCYERADAESRLHVEIDERGSLVLSSVRAVADFSSSAEIQYLQPPEGKVSLVLGAKPGDAIVAENLWQLLLAEREVCARELIPLLESLRSDWRLGERLDRAELRLAERAGPEMLAQRRAWRRWIDDLASPDFATRQAADGQLRACGQSVLAFLRQLDSRRLDAEQRRRVLAIVADLSDSSPDCPQRVAEWLAADKRVWLALLSRGDLEQRVVAAEHLSRLCQKPLAFNPAASADERNAQVAALSALLADN
jgi:hypothetical protein